MKKGRGVFMKKSFLLLFLLIAPPALADAEVLRTLPLEQQEVVAQSEKNEGMQKVTQTLLNNATLEMEHQCMKAVGNAAFCQCIARETPSRVNFMSYVSMVTGTREDFRYEYMSLDDKQLFDATRKARDACVSWRGKR
jgi:hypothetical protein